MSQRRPSPCVSRPNALRLPVEPKTLSHAFTCTFDRTHGAFWSASRGGCPVHQSISMTDDGEFARTRTSVTQATERDETWSMAAMFGIGHGGLESVALVGGLMVLTAINL
jgi:hypothetical protein